MRLHVCSFYDASGSAVLPNGKTAHWDFSRRFGPLFTDARGRELAHQPGTRSAAWRAFETWLHERNGEQLCPVCSGTGRGAEISIEEFHDKALGRRWSPGRHFWACTGGCIDGWVKRVQTSATLLPTHPSSAANPVISRESE